MSDSTNGPASPSPTPRDAAAPFNAGDADIILRSADGVDFRAHKFLLSMSSPFFQNLFTLPQPPTSSPHTSLDESKDGISVLCLSEDEHAVEMMLRYCYPRTVCPAEPTLDKTEDVKLALVLISKYQLAGVQGIVVQRLKAGPTLPKALSIFLKAWLLDLREVVPIAARHTLRTALIFDEEHEELLSMPAIVLIRLTKYRKACADATSACVFYQPLGSNMRTDIPIWEIKPCTGTAKSLFDVPSPLFSQRFVCPSLEQYLRDAADDLKIFPSNWKYTSQDHFVSAIEKVSSRCNYCKSSGSVAPAITHLSRLLYKEVDKCLSEIERKMSFY
ncbi:hypothetical protein FA95DRAFT_1680093 [Auriscalpium vulgare]|uniref:Uncharacterized protein n=1 Tax=Auriscalpium vulgare TaxID=40419 RepID=A0ACB8RPM3_9AGAM|nr:hypothetical protein FA95DRAFT_1680093 [Auriscalpium vulgare]